MISDKGTALIRNFEGCKLVPYLCPAGKPTIGIGHVIQASESFSTITLQEAMDLFFKDLAPIEVAITRALKMDIMQCEFDALCSFAFNLGIRALLGSTLFKLLNKGCIIEAADEFARWNKVAGKPMAGLTLRRQAEKDLFLGD